MRNILLITNFKQPVLQTKHEVLQITIVNPRKLILEKAVATLLNW